MNYKNKKSNRIFKLFNKLNKILKMSNLCHFEYEISSYINVNNKTLYKLTTIL